CGCAAGDRQVGTKEWSLRSNQGIGSCWRCPGRTLVVGVEQHLPFEQDTQHVEQTIPDGTQRSTVAVAARAQLGISALAGRLVLHGHPRPMEQGVRQATVAGMAAKDDALLAAAPRDRSDPAQGTPGVVVSLPQKVPTFGEQRGERDPADSREGAKDRDITLLVLLPRRALGCGLDGATDLVEPTLHLLDLLVDEAQPCRNRADV